MIHVATATVPAARKKPSPAMYAVLNVQINSCLDDFGVSGGACCCGGGWVLR